MALQPLAASIITSATVAADFIIPYSQVGGIYVLVDQLADENIQVGGIFALVDQLADEDVRVGGIFVLIDAYESPGFSVAITSSASTTANLTVKKALLASITVSATVTSDLIGLNYFTTSIVVSGTVTALFGTHLELSSSITTNVLVTADLEKYKAGIASSSLSLSSDGDVFTNIRVGNTLQLRQSSTLASTFNIASDLGVSLDHEVDYDLIQTFSSSQIVTFTQTVDFRHTLPTETASSVLNLTSEADPFRQGESTLLLIQEAVGVIYFLEGNASNTLVLTQNAERQTSVFNTLPSNLLILTQLVDYSWITNLTSQSWLLFKQNAVGTVVTSKKYVLLQAPYNFIQTSVVLPPPLFGDTENLISNINLRRAMNGLIYTYVKSSKSKILKYTFRLTRMKALELEEFFRYYNSYEIKMQNWKGEIWKVNLTTNPIDFVQTGRDAPTEDRTDVNIEFEGVKISG